MDPLNEKLITTKDAGDISGYTADYLSRLVRAGEITAKRTGHTWLINQTSLELFLDKQKIKKAVRARELADARVKEYRVHQKEHVNVPVVLVSKSYRPVHDFGYVPLRSHMLALSLSVAVVVVGAIGARSSVILQVAAYIAATAEESVDGFGTTFGGIPSRIASNIDSVYSALHNIDLHKNILPADVDYASRTLLSKLGFEPAHMDFRTYYDAPVFAAAGTTASISSGPEIGFQSIQKMVLDMYELCSTSACIQNSFIRVYVSIGTTVNSVIADALTKYRVLIEGSGSKALALAYTTQKFFPETSLFIDRMNLTLGTTVIYVTHMAIRTDVSLAYWFSRTAQSSAHTTFVIISSMGNFLAYNTSKVPSHIVGAYVYTTAIPASVAPIITQTIFGAEYATSMYFIASINSVSKQYLSLVENVGQVIYAGVANAPALLEAKVPSLSGVLGKNSEEPTFRLSTW